MFLATQHALRKLRDVPHDDSVYSQASKLRDVPHEVIPNAILVRNELEFPEPFQAVLLPCIPHRSLVTIQPMITGRKFIPPGLAQSLLKSEPLPRVSFF